MRDGEPVPAETFTVLTVCTGNVCRSPAVERLLRAELGAGTGVTVVSAGTGPVFGEPIHPPMAELLTGLRADIADFSSTLLTREMVVAADLVLGLTREHRAAVVAMVPAAVRRTFTLLEFARLVADVDRTELAERAGPGAGPASRLAAVLPLAVAHRRPVPAALDDVVDPFRREPAVYRRSLDQIRPAVAAIVALARGD